MINIHCIRLYWETTEARLSQKYRHYYNFILDCGKSESLKGDIEQPHTHTPYIQLPPPEGYEVQEQWKQIKLFWTASKCMGPSVPEVQLPEDNRFVLIFIFTYIQLKKQISIWKSSEVLSTTQCWHTFEAANTTPSKALMKRWISCKCN